MSDQQPIAPTTNDRGDRTYKLQYNPESGECFLLTADRDGDFQITQRDFMGDTHKTYLSREQAQLLFQALGEELK